MKTDNVEKPLTGTMTHVGEVNTLDGETLEGCFVEIPIERLNADDNIPIDRECVILEKIQYDEIMRRLEQITPKNP